jgi:hypothetical protein
MLRSSGEWAFYQALEEAGTWRLAHPRAKQLNLSIKKSSSEGPFEEFCDALEFAILGNPSPGPWRQ